MDMFLSRGVRWKRRLAGRDEKREGRREVQLGGAHEGRSKRVWVPGHRVCAGVLIRQAH